MNKELRAVLDGLFVTIQHILPHHLLSRMVGWLAVCRVTLIKDLLIDRFIAAFNVDMREAADPDPAAYAHFNAFFTRALRPDARPVDAAENSIVSPADGTVSQIGRLQAGRIMQAKSHYYSATELLADDHEARLFENGSFATIYLSPRDYHRVHMPVAARLLRLRYVPGRLFSVNQVTADGVAGVFARNERLVCLFDTEHGPLAVVLVGAMIVAGIESIWTGPVTPTSQHALTFELDMPEARRRIGKGDEMGRFMLGSTVIMLFPDGAVEWDAALAAGSTMRMGETIGRWQL